MGPKGSEEFDGAIVELEKAVYDYLAACDFWVRSDDGMRRMMEEDPDLHPICPELYIRYNKWKASGKLPMVSGGWYDQPYITSLAFEACEKAENQFYADRSVKTQVGQQPRQEAGTTWAGGFTGDPSVHSPG